MPADGESEGLKLDRNMFWDVIDSTNAAGPYPDQETWRCRMTAALEKHTMEEILDWQLILEEYMQSACRQDILAAAAARGIRRPFSPAGWPSPPVHHRRQPPAPQNGLLLSDTAADSHPDRHNNHPLTVLPFHRPSRLHLHDMQLHRLRIRCIFLHLSE